MAARSKKRKKRGSSISPLEQIKRLLERGNHKRALKVARSAYRKEPTNELRPWLEHAYIARVQQLIQTNQREDARRIVAELRELGVTEPAVEAALPDLLLSSGAIDRVPEGTSDAERQRLLVKMADQAVLHPDVALEGESEIKEGSRTVREALVALEQGDESSALSLVKGLSRQSPFADWKLFVRGLAAYYRNDKGEMEASWDRLHADRPAAKITRPLRAMLGGGLVDDCRLKPQVARLESAVADGATISLLERIRQLAAEGQWGHLRKPLRSVRGSLDKLDDRFYGRVVTWLATNVVSSGNTNGLEQLARAVDGPPHDPRWNRARALMTGASLWEDEATKYWKKYRRDLNKVTALSDDDRRIARGLVSFRIAVEFAEDARSLRRCRCGADHTEEVRESDAEAAAAFDECAALIPAYTPAYEAMAQWHLGADRNDEVAATYRKALEHDPNNVDLLRSLAVLYVEQDEPREGVEFAERALQHRPLDASLRRLVWTCRVGAVRELAREDRIDEAREQFVAAGQVDTERNDEYDALARKAVLEVKAGCRAAVGDYVDKAGEQLEELTAFWMVMAVESIRYGVKAEDQQVYEKRWADSLKKRCRSQTAGLMCKMMRAHASLKHPYSQLDRHLDMVVKYIRRCVKVKWQPADLLDVCEFLMDVDEPDLLERYIKQGLRKCPDSAALYALSGIVEMDRGPWDCDRDKAEEAFERAIELAEDSDDPRDKEFAEEARQRLVALRGHADAPPFADYEYDYEYDDEYDDEDGDFFGMDPADMSPSDLMDVIVAAAEKLGVSPEEVMETLLTGVRNGRKGKR